MVGKVRHETNACGLSVTYYVANSLYNVKKSGIFFWAENALSVWLVISVISVYLFIVATGCLSERPPTPKTVSDITGDSARIQDETTESSA